MAVRQKANGYWSRGDIWLFWINSDAVNPVRPNAVNRASRRLPSAIPCRALSMKLNETFVWEATQKWLRNVNIWICGFSWSSSTLILTNYMYLLRTNVRWDVWEFQFVWWLRQLLSFTRYCFFSIESNPSYLKGDDDRHAGD